MNPPVIRSRDNALLVRLRKLVRSSSAYRQGGQAWLEGEHLCSSMAERNLRPTQSVVSESAMQVPHLRALAQWAPRTTVVADELFKGLSGLESPARLGYVVAVPPPDRLDPHSATVVLDRLQDAGNVGSILRSAAAFGIRQVVALQGTAALWSPKVLRAGMGAHFGLRLHENLEPAGLDELDLPLIGTSLQATDQLHQARLPWPCAWVFGHEGQGISHELQARCSMTVRIAQPGGEESLNVAAAAAICLHESIRGLS